ncbi:MAG: RNA polymerase sigma factor [Oscillospiraceae bacterium]
MKARFNRIYEEQKDAVYAYLLYMTKDAETAEDLSQDTFLKIYLNLFRFRGDCSEKTWALKIARNTFLSYARKKKPILLEEQAWEGLPGALYVDPEENVLLREREQMITSVLLALREDDRSVLLLRDYEGLPYQEIGRIMGLSEAAVKLRIFRARKRYQALYRQCSGETRSD